MSVGDGGLVEQAALAQKGYVFPLSFPFLWGK
jgi:hypothetical protein